MTSHNTTRTAVLKLRVSQKAFHLVGDPRMRRYLSPLAIVITLCLAGCATNVSKTFDQYVEATLDKSEQSQARGGLRDKKQKAAVFAYEETSSNYTKNVNVKGVAVNRIEDFLQKAGLELVSRRGDERRLLEEETKLYKFFAGSGQYTGPTNSDYTVMGVLTSVDSSGTYRAPYTFQNVKIPAKCQYSATVTGALRVYSVDEGKILQAINLRGNSSREEDTTSSNCTVTTNILPLVRNAVEEALNSQRPQLQNIFSQKGFVVDKRVNKNDKKDMIFRVSLGKNDGLEQGTKLEVYTRFLYQDRMVGESRADERKVADGEVTDYVGDDYAWISVSNTEEANKIKLGDHVKVLHKKTMGEAIMDPMKKILPLGR